NGASDHPHGSTALPDSPDAMETGWTCSRSTRPRRACTQSRTERMRVVVALGGNALLGRGQELSAENLRGNMRVACAALAPVAAEHELVISHGNGPQVGLPAPQDAAYREVELYPL